MLVVVVAAKEPKAAFSPSQCVACVRASLPTSAGQAGGTCVRSGDVPRRARAGACRASLIDTWPSALLPPCPASAPPRPTQQQPSHLPSSSPRHQHRPGRPPVAAALPSKLDYALPPRRLPGLFVRLSRLDAHTHVRRRRRARADEARQAGVGRPSSSLGVRGDRLSPHGRALAAECNERGHAH